MKIEASLKIMSLLFLIGGFVPLFVVNYFRDKKKKLKHWKKAKAIVYDFWIEMSEGTHPISKPAFLPKYKYSYEGREYSGIASVGVGENTYEVGDIIEIYFDPSNPAESDLPHFFKIGKTILSTFDIFIITFTIMTILFSAAGIGAAVLLALGTFKGQ